MKIKFIFYILAFMFCMSAFCVPTFASDGGKEMLTVNAARLDGDIIRIDVTDVAGVQSSLALRLSDYIKETDNSEFISIQAVDLAGNNSGVIEIKNPYYKPPTAETTPKTTEIIPPVTTDENKPFTPNGSGEVLDNAKEGYGKEFFTITTEDKNVFYLIVDRQKTGENVYLLNAVTEDDLTSLATKNGKKDGISAIPTPEVTPTPPPTPEPATAPSPIEPENNSRLMIFAIIAVIIGSVAYYLKIYKPKKEQVESSEDTYYNESEIEDDTDYEIEEDETEQIYSNEEVSNYEE